MALILGIESTAHTFGVGIVRDGKIIANVKKTYTTEKGGIIPIDAAKHHRENKEKIYSEAISLSGIEEKEIDAVAFSQGPGLAPCLLEGMRFAKKLSLKLKKPLVPVNHCVAHLEVGGSLQDGPKDPVMLYTSGANTQIIAYASGKYRIFGETLDIGIGNFIDNFARYIGMGFPGGPKIEKIALNGKNYVELPYNVKGMDFALSGILTNLKQKVESKKFSKEDLAYSLQETVFAMLVEVSERALAHVGKKELLLGGGVGCNKRLQEMCRIMCGERGARFFVPDNSVLVDNGAMIAFLGEIILNTHVSPPTHPKEIFNKKNHSKKSTANLIYYPNDLKNLDIKPRQRTDEVEVKWR